MTLLRDFLRPTIQSLIHGIRARTVSSAELTHDCLRRIEQLNPKLNAFITVLADSALDEARRAEQEIFRGNYRGPLHGIPIGLKDILDTEGTRTTAASASSKIAFRKETLKWSQAGASGAIILGKQNLHEFAYGGSCLISAYGEVHNPWNTARLAGGFIGRIGSVSSARNGPRRRRNGYCRLDCLPAAYCGVVGLKPTYGRVSARGVIPLAWSYDHVGPLTNSVCDAGLMLQVLAGYDAGDPASVDQPVADYTCDLGEEIRDLRIGIPRAYFFDNLDPEVAAAVEKAIEKFRELGADVRDEIRLEVSTDRTLSSAESYAYHKEFVARSPELYQPTTLSRISAGKDVHVEDIFRAQKQLAANRRDIQAIFDQVDILLTPTVPILPPSIADLKKNPDNLRPAELMMLRNTRPFNVWGIPVISLPCGFSSDGMPIGLQLAAAPWKEEIVLRAARAYEQATEWHERTPELEQSA